MEKYKNWEYTRGPNGNSKGQKTSASDNKLVLYGPWAYYSNKKTIVYFTDNLTSKFIGKTQFAWDLVDEIILSLEVGLIKIKTEKGIFRYLTTQIKEGKSDELSIGPGRDVNIYFYAKQSDKNGDVKKDMLEVVELLKKIVKENSGKELKVTIDGE